MSDLIKVKVYITDDEMLEKARVVLEQHDEAIEELDTLFEVCKFPEFNYLQKCPIYNNWWIGSIVDESRKEISLSELEQMLKQNK